MWAQVVRLYGRPTCVNESIVLQCQAFGTRLYGFQLTDPSSDLGKQLIRFVNVT